MAYTLEFFSLQTETSIKILHSSLEKVLIQIIRFLFTLEKKENVSLERSITFFCSNTITVLSKLHVLVTTRANELKQEYCKAERGYNKTG